MTVATVCVAFVGNLVGGSHISSCGLIRKLDRSRFRPLVLVQYGEGISQFRVGVGSSQNI